MMTVLGQEEKRGNTVGSDPDAHLNWKAKIALKCKQTKFQEK